MSLSFPPGVVTGQNVQEVFRLAKIKKFAIPAVNVFTMEQIIALFRSGEKADAPFIVQITPAARDYANSNILLSI